MSTTKTLMIFLPALIAGLACCAQTNEVREMPAGFDPYKTIIERKPFGPEPANFNPDAPGTAGNAAGETAGAAADQQSEEEKKIIDAVRISALNVTPSGKIAVGFTDNSKQPAGTYYLKVGESRDGWLVKSADAREMKVTLEKGGVEATLSLGEQSGGKGAAKTAAATAAPPSNTAAAPSEPSPHLNTFERLRARRAFQMRAQKEEDDRKKLAAEEDRKERERKEAQREEERRENERLAQEERQQQRNALLQIQEELRRQREQKEQNQDGRPQDNQQQNDE